MNSPESKSKYNGFSQNGTFSKPVAKKTPAERDNSVENHPSVSGIVDAVLEIGRQRNTLLADMRIALESGNERKALELARCLCGLNNEQSN